MVRPDALQQRKSAAALRLARPVKWLESRRGQGLYVKPGARERLRNAERERFLREDWPRLRQHLRRLGIGPTQLDWGLM